MSSCPSAEAASRATVGPLSAKTELAARAEEIEVGLTAGTYYLTEAELAGIRSLPPTGPSLHQAENDDTAPSAVLLSPMAPRPLADTLSRAASWPVEAQVELAAYAAEIEAALVAGEYQPTEAELAGIDRGLADARAGRFATDDDVAAVFARFRGV